MNDTVSDCLDFLNVFHNTLLRILQDLQNELNTRTVF